MSREVLRSALLAMVRHVESLSGDGIAPLRHSSDCGSPMFVDMPCTKRGEPSFPCALVYARAALADDVLSGDPS